MGLEQIQFPYSPPKDMIEELDLIHLIINSESYVVLRSPYHGEKSWIFIYYKTKSQWDKYSVKGDESFIRVINSYIISKTGFMPERGSQTRYTGEYELINLETGERQILKLEEPGDIYVINEDCIIAKSKDKLLYIPAEENIYRSEKAIVVYEDNDEKEPGTLDRVVYQTQVAFLGPKEIPVEVMRQRARELNKLGEKYYQEISRYYDKVIYYFKEAIKFNPEHAQAYSNLGLAYYKIKRYDESIEHSRKAIELTDNDIIKASSYYNIGMAYEAKEEWEKALKNYEKALRYRDHDAYREGIRRMKVKINLLNGVSQKTLG